MSEQTNQSTFTEGTTFGATGYTTGYTTTLEDSTLFATRDSTDISNIDDTRLDMNIEHRENPWESPTTSLCHSNKQTRKRGDTSKGNCTKKDAKN